MISQEIKCIWEAEIEWIETMFEILSRFESMKHVQVRKIITWGLSLSSVTMLHD